MKYVIQITDMDGKSCRIKLSLPFFKNITRTDNSTWNVLDEGLLKFRSGGCEIRSSTGKGDNFVNGDLKLYVVTSHGSGIFVKDFLDEFSLANSSGGGSLAQPWVTGMKPGDIGWVLIE